MTFEVGQGVSRINPQGFYASVWERGYFFVCFFTFETLKCGISQNIEENLADLFGVSMYYCLM